MKNKSIILLVICGLMVLSMAHPVNGCTWYQWQGNNRNLSQDLAACNAAAAIASKYPNDPAGLNLFRECMRNNGWLCLDTPDSKNKAGVSPTTSVNIAPVDTTPKKDSNLGTIHVSFEPANVYEKPGLDEIVVERVNRSTDLKALVESALWVQVQTPSGKQGWIAKNWVLELEKK